MKKQFEITKQFVPDEIMEDLRQRRGLEPMDTSQDEDILAMDGWDFLNEWLGWQGIYGYTSDIIEVIGYAFGVDLVNDIDEIQIPERETY